MSKTILEKGFKVIIPKDIQMRVSFREGERLIVKLAGRDAIVLQRPSHEKTRAEAVDESFGIWKKEFLESKDSVSIVNKLRKSWRRRLV